MGSCGTQYEVKIFLNPCIPIRTVENPLFHGQGKRYFHGFFHCKLIKRRNYNKIVLLAFKERIRNDVIHELYSTVT